MASTKRDALAEDFKRAMQAAARIFGQQAFRKPRTGRPNQISKPLFEAWGVQLARCTPHEIDGLANRREEIQNRFSRLLQQDPEFYKAISLSTGMRQRIHKRFAVVRDLVREFI